MKPIDIFDAMDGISEEYIKETEQAVSRKSRSRTENTHTVDNTGTVRSAAGRKPVSGKHGSPAKQKPQIRKKETDSIQPVWQRIATGITAAAACAVFVGGGWFIVQQAKQTQPGTADSLTEEGERNFLGGTGEIHVAVSSNYPIHGLDLMYDDTNVYFYGGKYTANRNSDTVSEAHPTDESVQNILSHTLWDGEQFYYQDGDCLYKMDMAGNRDTSTPFYEVDPGFAEQKKALSARESFPENAEYSDTVICGIQKLREDEYVISLYADISENGKCIGSCGGAEVYRPQDKSEPRHWEQAPGMQGEIVLVRDNLAVFRSQGFGRFACWDPNTPAGIPTGVEDPAMAEMYSSTLMTLGDGETTKPAEYDAAWAVYQNSIYYMTEIVSDNVNYEPSHYAALDINTGAFTDFGQAGFDTFIPADDEILYVTRDGKALCSSEYTLSALTKQELFSYENDSIPAEIQNIISTKWNAKPLRSLDAADANYAAISLDCNDDSCSAVALYDRQAGQMHYYKVKGFTADDLQNYDENTEPVDQNGEINALGGTGTLYPVGWTNHGETAMLRDDSNYYCYYYEKSCWFRCPFTDSQFTPLAYLDDDSPLCEGFMSDGERVFTRDLNIVSDGSAKNRFDPSDVQNYLQTLNEDAEENGLYYYCCFIWHLRDRYFLEITSKPVGEYGPGDENTPLAYEVWTDNNGRFISGAAAQNGTTCYYCSDDRSEMYAIINYNLHIRECPGDEGDCKPDPTAYGMITDAYCAGDDEYYITTDYQLYTRENGEPVLITDMATRCLGLKLAPDHRFFYSGEEEDGDALYEWNGSRGEMIYRPEGRSYLIVEGFESDGSGRYSILVNQINSETQTFDVLFIDPDTHEIIRQISG